LRHSQRQRAAQVAAQVRQWKAANEEGARSACALRSALPSQVSHEDVTDWPWGGAVRLQYPQICIKGLSQKKTGSTDSPPPPVPPPVLGSLVRSAEGLPSTRNWPFRWHLSPTSPPQVISKAM
jgi:hypothetical protein